MWILSPLDSFSFFFLFLVFKWITFARLCLYSGDVTMRKLSFCWSRKRENIHWQSEAVGLVGVGEKRVLGRRNNKIKGPGWSYSWHLWGRIRKSVWLEQNKWAENEKDKIKEVVGARLCRSTSELEIYS